MSAADRSATRMRRDIDAELASARKAAGAGRESAAVEHLDNAGHAARRLDRMGYIAPDVYICGGAR